MGNSDHVVVLGSIEFLSNSNRDASVHYLNFDYYCTELDDRRDHVRDVPGRISSNLVLLQLLLNFTSGFRLYLMYIK